MKKIVGILALQGDYLEHQKIFQDLNVENILVKNSSDLKKVSHLVIPGGESTAFRNLLTDSFKKALIKRINLDMPVLGTCAGVIMLAKSIVGEEPILGVLDVTVLRNGYGRQSNSFFYEDIIPLISPDKIIFEFIRAPIIQSCSEKVTILKEINAKIVGVQQNKIIGLTFHPELTNAINIFEYFLNL